jgi:hypothetical protein
MLVIKEATYGLGANTADVTKTLQSMIKDDSIDIIVGPKSLGTDPSVGSAKKLSVIYLVNGVQEQKTIADGSQFAIYSAKKAAEDKDPRNKAGQATTSLYKTILSGLSTFLHLLGVGITYKVGTSIFDPIIGYVLTGIALVVPYFGLWGVPLIVFWYRIFVTSDLAGLASVPVQVVKDMSNVAK